MGIFHISEEEAARDFRAVLARVRASDCVVVACADGMEAVINVQWPATFPPGRPLAEVLEILRQRRETLGPATVDDDFATDMASFGDDLSTATVRGKTAEEVLRDFARWEAEHGKLTFDATFADDLDDIHRIYNEPMDVSRWD